MKNTKRARRSYFKSSKVNTRKDIGLPRKDLLRARQGKMEKKKLDAEVQTPKNLMKKKN